MPDSLPAESETIMNNNQHQHQQANKAFAEGRYCIGCQAVGVKTDWAGYCDTCLAGFAEREKAREAKDAEKQHQK